MKLLDDAFCGQLQPLKKRRRSKETHLISTLLTTALRLLRHVGNRLIPTETILAWVGVGVHRPSDDVVGLGFTESYAC